MMGPFSLWFPLLTTLGAAWVILGLAPRLFGSPLATISPFQPDFALTLIATAVSGVLWAVWSISFSMNLRRRSHPAPQAAAQMAPLSEREREVALLTADGLSIVEIAERLSSPWGQWRTSFTAATRDSGSRAGQRCRACGARTGPPVGLT